MSTVTNSTDRASAAAMAANASTNNLMGDTQDRFLTLLVTQLQNQDPLNPMDNAQVTSQIAQLSTVNGINQLNNTLLALSGQMDVSQSMQAAGLIGKEVLVPGVKISVGATADDGVASTPFGVDVISPSANVTVTITDSAGKAVRTLDLGPKEVGVISVEWDGKDDQGANVTPGAYTFQVASKDANGAAVSADALTYGKVGSVAYTSQGLTIDLGLAGQYSLLDLRKIM
ncbi:MAG TPA: flagellar hook capping FlgD N-terminal domain-containing protein [Candidimonas sp.]|nr:flagellar hook capping FlgD N-terminal domain-containing protein [Candidimonas sp.]